MLYFTKLPDHRDPGFNEQMHFANFKRHNMLFNAVATKSNCDRHVGCLSIKTVRSGTEAYRFQGLQRTVRPGQFLILNDDQPYSSTIDASNKVKSLAVFFTNDFSTSVFRDAVQKEEKLLDDPFETTFGKPEFFQTLYPLDPALGVMLTNLADEAEHGDGDELLVFILHHMVRVHGTEVTRSGRVDAIKSATKKEVYKRLCIARDLLHSSFMNDLDLSTISQMACLSVPQLVRQFKIVFKTTPHQSLRRIRLSNAATQLKNTDEPVQNIAVGCGFENTSAFCRAFKMAYNTTPQAFRLKN